ncbi:hypothetical protein [Spirosoma validum]|nr:hypothetical protein [Spirosoma validum]
MAYKPEHNPETGVFVSLLIMCAVMLSAVAGLVYGAFKYLF